MEILNQIIELAISGFTNEKILQALGSVNKRIGNNLILDSKTKGILGIGVVINDDKISKISFQLEEAIPFINLSKLFKEYYLGYNNYDGISMVNFELYDKVKLTARKNGYINSDELFNHSFSEFDLIRQ